MILHAISDTHSNHKYYKQDKCDILTHSGDYANSRANSCNEFLSFLDWFKDQEARYKIFISGNHDFETFNNLKWCRKEIEKRGLIYLENESITIEGVKFYGTPWVPQFFNWAYMTTENRLEKIYSCIDDDTQVLLTHTPPYKTLDKTNSAKHVGSKSLLHRIKEIDSIKLVVSGHIHESTGILDRYNKKFINASSFISTRDYIEIDLKEIIK